MIEISKRLHRADQSETIRWDRNDQRGSLQIACVLGEGSKRGVDDELEDPIGKVLDPAIQKITMGRG